MKNKENHHSYFFKKKKKLKLLINILQYIINIYLMDYNMK